MVLLSFLLTGIITYGQSQKLERIIKLREAAEEAQGDRKAKILNDLTAEWFSINLDSASKYANIAKLYIENNKFRKLKIDMYINLFEIEMLDSSYVKNLNYLYKAEKIAKEFNEIEKYVFALNKIADNFIDKKNFMKASAMLDEASKLCREYDIRKQLAFNFFLKGKLAVTNKNYTLAKAHFNKCLNIHKNEDIGNPTGVFREVGNLYYHLGKYQEALDVYQNALPYIKEYEDRVGEGYIQMNIGLTFMELGYYERASIHFLRSLEAKESYSSNSNNLLVRTYISENNIRAEKLNTARKEIDSLIKQYSDIEHRFKYRLYKLKGEWYYEKNKLDSSYVFMNKADSIASKNNKELDAISKLKYSIAEGDFETIRSTFKYAKEYYSNLNNEVKLAHVHLLIAEYYYKKEKFKESIKNLNKISIELFQSPDIIVNKINLAIRSHAELNQKKEIKILDEKQEKIIDQLNNSDLSDIFVLKLAENKLYQNSQELSILEMRIFWLSLAMGSALIIFIVFWEHNRRKRKKIAFQFSLKESELKKSLIDEKRKHKKEVEEKIDLLKNRNQFLSELKDMVNENYNEKPKVIRKDIKQIFTSIDKQIKECDNKVGDDLILYEEAFISKLKKMFPRLTKKEIRICVYLRMEFSNEEIASLCQIQVSSVAKNRYRIRKKLELKRNENLEEFLADL